MHCGSQVMTNIMTAAADEKGEWYIPLTEEQVQKVRKALDIYEAQLDEALLSTAFAWIRKCTEDRYDTMVALIQKVLQLYSARQLQTSATTGIEAAINEVIYAEEQHWGSLIHNMVASERIGEAEFMEGLQKRMETTVLALESGSYAQRVQAEYLKEVEARAKAVFKQIAAQQPSGGQ